MIRIGIPRALLFYQYYPMWKTFFEELGAEVVVSPPTTRAMLASGSSRVVAETCLPVKAFMGHVLYITGKCDYVFIPAIRSTQNNSYNCAKFLGLPDMTRAVIPESPPILDIDIDINQGKRKLYQAIYRLGRHFSWNPLKVKQAALSAWQAHWCYREAMYRRGLTPPQVIEKTLEVKEQSPKSTLSQTTIAFIGHPYLLYDDYLNHRLIQRLEQSNCKILTPEMLTPHQLEPNTTELGGKSYWTYEKEIVGAGEFYLRSKIDGIIGIMAFGCGPDSLMMDTVHRQADKLRAVPFMSLTLDEHTAETGMITRLEAFLDMVYRRKRKEAKVCV